MTLSAVVITKDEEKWIENCLRSIEGLAEEIVVVDCGSKDKTVDICKKLGAKVYSRSWEGFAKQKNFALGKTTGDWVLFIDADERVSKKLGEEIREVISAGPQVPCALPRQNVLLGEFMHHGGWWPDYVTRLAPRAVILGWEGELHEELKVKGEAKKLTGPLYHLSHRGLTWMLEKSIGYTDMEAQLRLLSNHPPIVGWRLVRVVASEFCDRLIRKHGWRDGTVGWIEALSQAFNYFLIYARLWEKQKGKPMEEIYREIDRKLPIAST